MPVLRRARHYFATRYERSSRRIVLYGEITCAGCTTSRVRVSVRQDGAVGIGFIEDTTDWTWDDLEGWWFYGAWLVTSSGLSLLGCSGPVFTCHLAYSTSRLQEISIESQLPMLAVPGRPADL